MTRKSPRWILILAASVSVAALLALYFYDYRNTRAAEIAQATERARSVGKMYAEHVARTFGAVDVMVEELSQMVADVRNWQSWPEPVGHRLLMQRKTQALPQLRDLAIFNAAGTQLFHSSFLPAARISIADRPYFLALQGGSKRELFGPYVGRNSGTYTYALSRRIKDARGAFAGVMFAAIEPEYFQSICRNFLLGQHVELALANAKGTVVASCRVADRLQDAEGYTGKNVASALAGGRFANDGPQPSEQSSGDATLIRHTVPGFPELSVYTAFSEREILIDWAKRQFRLILIVGAAIVSILLAFAALFRQFRRASEANQALADSRSQLEIRVHEAVAEIEERTRAAEAAADTLRAAKEAAELANTAKTRFLAAASHDLRQPMQALNLFAAALSGTQLDEQQSQLCQNLLRSGAALGSLLDSLLDISRLDAGMVKPRHQRLDLHLLFEQIDIDFATIAKAKGLRFKLWYPAASLILETDHDLLLRILRNLISNAIRYTDRGGVLVAARQRQSRLDFQIWDTGIGIAEEEQTKIWDEFYQINNPHRDRTQGLGLGLAIVRRMANLLGHTLSCRSRPGQGSVFELSLSLLPLATTLPITPIDDAKDRMEGVELEVLSTGLRGKRLVLIEDDQLVAESIKAWLTTLEMQVEVFVTAETALADTAIASADVFITDFRLPGKMNGLEFLEIISLQSRLPIKAIVITGDIGADLLPSFAAAPWQILHKPVSPQKLLTTLSELLSTPNMLAAAKS